MSLHGALDPDNASEALSLQNGEYLNLLSLVRDESGFWAGRKLSLGFLCIVCEPYTEALS